MEMETVLEVTADGSFDTDVVSAVPETKKEVAERLREAGNTAFQNKDFASACSKYTEAIQQDTSNHLLYGNRSAAYAQLKDFTNALVDAERAIALVPQWTKGYLRKAMACEGLKRYQDAIDAYNKLLTLEADGSTSTEAVKARTKIQSLRAKLKASTSGSATSAVRTGFLDDKKKNAMRKALYEEKDDVVKIVEEKDGSKRIETSKERTWRVMLRRLLDGCNRSGVNAQGERVVLDDGVFAKLLNDDEFQKLIYPGIPKEQLQHAPQNLRELLEDPWYEQELLALMPKVEAKAESVLTNVKKRGAAQGEVMDAATEQVLYPQVLQEAFGREVLAMVRRVNYKKHMLLANDERLLADPQSEFATWDQLDDEFLNDLFSVEPRDATVVAGAAVMDEFLGEEWIEVIRDDVERMAKHNLLMEMTSSVDAAVLQRTNNGKLTNEDGDKKAKPSNGKMRFIEHADCQLEYPALAELLEKLHALPYEINKKKPDHARLCAQFAHCTCLHMLSTEESQHLRLDCGSGEKDNGFKLTCIYFFNTISSSTADTKSSTVLELRTSLNHDSIVQKVYPVADRLVIFNSQHVYNAITPVSTDEKLFYLTFWIHGKALS